MTQAIAQPEPWMAPTPWGRVAQARRDRGWSQKRLAEALSEATGTHWSRDMVAKLERDGKTFTLQVLIAVARVQHRPYDWYIKGTDLEFELSRISSVALAKVLPFRKRASRPMEAIRRPVELVPAG